MYSIQRQKTIAMGFYNGNDPRELPLYSIQEAGRFIGVVPSTLRNWVAGGASAAPLVRVPDENDGRLSFNNLVEAHVLASLKRQHGIRIQSIRRAIEYAEHEMQVAPLLLRDELRTSAGELFWLELNRLVNLSRSGQLAIRKLLESSLQRIERDSFALPVRLYPLISSGNDRKTVVIDPTIAFGQPVVHGSGVSTANIIRRIDAGESIAEVAYDHDLDEQTIEDVILYEKAAA